MRKSTTHTIKNIFKVSAVVIIVNVFGLTTQYMLDSHNDRQNQSVAEYTHSLIKGKLLPLVVVVFDRFHK